MSDTLPSWEQTRDKILDAGVDEGKLDATIEAYTKSMGAAIKSKDLIYFMVAQKEFGVSMPKITTLGGGGGGGGEPSGNTDTVTLDEVRSELQSDFVKVRVYVDSLDFGETRKGGDKCIAWAYDAKGRTKIEAYNERADDMYNTLSKGKFYLIDGLSVWQKPETERWDASTSLTWTRATKVEELNNTVQDFFPNAGVNSINNGQPCYYVGYVTDEDTNTYEGCATCKKSFRDIETKACGRGNGTIATCNPSKEEYTMYKVSITDGNSSYTADFGSNYPENDIKGAVCQVLGTYDERNGAIHVSDCKVLEKNAIPAYDEVVSGHEDVETPVDGDSEDPTNANNNGGGTSLRNITPDEVLLNLVKRTGLNPVSPVRYKLVSDCNMSPPDADKFIRERIDDGTLASEFNEEGEEILRWNK